MDSVPTKSATQPDRRRRNVLAGVPNARHTLDGVAELGRLYHVNGYNQEAERFWRVLHQAQPQEARWCYCLGDLRRTANDDAGTASFLEQTLKLAPDYAPALLRLAELEFKIGELDAAGRCHPLPRTIPAPRLARRSWLAPFRSGGHGFWTNHFLQGTAP